MTRYALLVLLLLLPACVKNYYPAQQDGAPASPTTPTPVVTRHTIEFRVLGTVPLADVTFGSAQDGTTRTQTALPWSSSFTTTRTTLFVYLKAESSFNGTITAQIFVDGQFFREATNNFFGSTNVADASGTLDLTP